MRVCWVKTKLLCLKLFKGLVVCLSKIGKLDLIFFSFAIGDFCCCTNVFGLVYVVLDFRFTNFFMTFKMRKVLEVY